MTNVSGNINDISSNDVATRLKQINQETPALWTTSLIKEPQELTVRTAARNNIMLDKVLQNQNQIIKNQQLIMNKLGVGENLNVVG